MTVAGNTIVIGTTGLYRIKCHCQVFFNTSAAPGFVQLEYRVNGSITWANYLCTSGRADDNKENVDGCTPPRTLTAGDVVSFTWFNRSNATVNVTGAEGQAGTYEVERIA